MALLITLGGGDGRSQARYRAQRAGAGASAGAGGRWLDNEAMHVCMQNVYFDEAVLYRISPPRAME